MTIDTTVELQAPGQNCAGRHPNIGRARDFAHDTGGAVAIMFALIVVLLFGAVGGSVDFARAYQARNAFQNALDAGSLAGARAKQMGASDAEALLAADAYLKPVKDRYKLAGTASFAIAGGGSVMEGTVRVAMPTTFLSVMGFDNLPISLANAARFSLGTNVELSLMLDVTGSMKGQKIADLQSAVQELIDIVIIDNDPNANSRIGIAPFSNAVKLDHKSFEAATGKNNSGKSSYSGCVVERTGPANSTDAGPGPATYVVPLEDVAPDAKCETQNRDLFGLTDKKSDLKKMVKALSAGGSTAGHLGTAWAWYLLSPNWASVFDSKSAPAPYSDLQAKNASGGPKLRKIAVLMTDGEYNTQYSAVDSTTQARRLCTEMKAVGVEVFTVGFQLGGNAKAIDTLKMCATNSSSFYQAETGDDIKRAFRDIALKSSPLRISR